MEVGEGIAPFITLEGGRGAGVAMRAADRARRAMHRGAHPDEALGEEDVALVCVDAHRTFSGFGVKPAATQLATSKFGQSLTHSQGSILPSWLRSGE